MICGNLSFICAIRDYSSLLCSFAALGFVSAEAEELHGLLHRAIEIVVDIAHHETHRLGGGPGGGVFDEGEKHDHGQKTHDSADGEEDVVAAEGFEEPEGFPVFQRFCDHTRGESAEAAG